MVRKARISDAPTIANIHFLQLNSDFLSSLGESFLFFLYKAFISSKKIEILVYEEKSKVLGFITGSIDFKETFKSIMLNNFFKFLSLILPSVIINAYLLKNIFETFIYTNKQLNLSIKAELISIAVDSKHHRKGIGKKLIHNLEKVFLSKNIKTYKVSVNKNNENANFFYQSLNFKKRGEYSLYNKKINLYSKNIS